MLFRSRESILAFTANREGTYPIICAELCGAYHGGMKSSLHVENPQDYDKWVQENTLAENQNLDKAVAVNPASLSNSEFLAPYAEDMGIGAETLAHLHHHHN